MSCCKYIIQNTSNSIATFNYKRCDDEVWYNQEGIKPNQVKTVWLEQYTYSTAFPKFIRIISSDCNFSNFIVTPTHSNTPSNTPTLSLTPSVTPSHTHTPTMTQTTTPTVTPTVTQTQTQTPAPSCNVQINSVTPTQSQT